MRGANKEQGVLFSYVSPESRVPQEHPLRALRKLTDAILREMSRDFDAMYSDVGRPSIPPERLLRALLLQLLYSIRSERLLMEQLDYNLLFRWFVGLSVDEPVWDHSVYSHNRDRLLNGNAAEAFFEHTVALAEKAGLLSDEHFTVDGTLIEAWASMKSVKPKDAPRDGSSTGEGRNPSVDFRGEKRGNATHASTTDGEARMYRKGEGKETKLCYMGHVLMENRNGLVVDGRLTLATGTAEREAAVDMVHALPSGGRVTVGADKAYDTAGFVEALRDLDATPHVAQNTSGRMSAIDGRTTRHAGYAISQRLRKLIEQIFGWLKTYGNQRKTLYRGRDNVGWHYVFALSGYNLIRIRNLEVELG
jgi:transposase